MSARNAARPRLEAFFRLAKPRRFGLRANGRSARSQLSAPQKTQHREDEKYDE
jgi:hypothetical protein